MFASLAAIEKCSCPNAAFAEQSTKTVPAVPAATASISRAAVAFAQPAPTATEGPVVTPAAASLPAVNIQDDNETSTEKNALYSVLRVIGSGVTPFNLNRQKTLLNALGQVISTVDFNKIYITDVNPVFASRRRQLLMEAEYQQEMVVGHRRALLASAYANQADVTVQMIADSSSTLPATIKELNTSIANKTLLTQLQTLGQASWIVQLVNSTITTPNSINATTKNFCRDQFGHWCLDKHKHLSSAGVRGVIAGGIIGIICVLALAMILKDLHGAHAMKDNEVVYNPQTPTMGGGPGTGKGAGGGVTAVQAHAGSPAGHSPTTAGYTGGLAPVGQKIRRKSGAFTSGAVTHPASLAAAGKPTGLEDIVANPSFSRSAASQSSATGANQRRL
ncbi:hypothetical protein ABBQ32_011204 [Trebouxia sp. C0010 RCD-2024]